MNRYIAADLLGIKISNNPTRHDIERAWKLKLLHIHPDKNPAPNAKEKTQELNEAKYTLLQVLFGEGGGYASSTWKKIGRAHV